MRLVFCWNCCSEPPMRQSRLCANQCWSAKTFKASISPRYLGFRPQAASQWWTRGAVPVAALVIQRHGLNSFEVQGVLNRWGSACENCKKLIDSHCSLLPPFFKYSVQVCPASLWAEMDLLAVNPETLRRQASRVCYTEHLHHQALGLEARVMQINQIRCKRLNWEQAMVKQMATIATRCLLTHPLQQPHTLRVQHSGCTYVSHAEKKWWAMSEGTAYDLRLKVLKLLAYFSKAVESSGRKWRGEDWGWAEMGFATSYLHYTERQHNFSMIACATSHNSRFCCRKPFIRQAED